MKLKKKKEKFKRTNLKYEIIYIYRERFFGVLILKKLVQFKEDQSNLLKNLVEFKEKSRPKKNTYE